MSLTKCQKYLHKLSNTDVNDEKFNLYLEKLNFWYGRGGKLFTSHTEKLISKLNMSNDIDTYDKNMNALLENIKSEIKNDKNYPNNTEQIIKEKIYDLIGKLDFIDLLTVIKHFFNIEEKYNINIFYVLYKAYDTDKNYFIELEQQRLYRGYYIMNKKNYNIIFNTLFQLIIENKSIDENKKIFAEEHQMIEIIVKKRICPSFAGKQLSKIISELYQKLIGKDINQSLLTQINVLTIKSNIEEIIGKSNEPTKSKKKPNK